MRVISTYSSNCRKKKEEVYFSICGTILSTISLCPSPDNRGLIFTSQPHLDGERELPHTTDSLELR